MARRAGSGRAAFALNATVSVALLGMIAAVALVVKPAAPPGIAEFAPQAAKPITKAPQSQSSTNGDGTGACAEGQKCQGPSPKPSPKPAAVVAQDVIKGVPSALQCYAWPDGSVTQTFDPQSAPCVANWPEADKGNGGSTTKGVNASTIRVAIPVLKLGDTTKFKPLVDFLNTRYQLYGRKLQLVEYESQQADFDGTKYEDATKQRADAAAVSGLNVFAALDTFGVSSSGSALPAYVDTLADRGVVTVTGGAIATLATADSMSRHAPYQWTVMPTIEDLLVESAVVYCKQLTGKNATHSTATAAKQRKVAFVVPPPSRFGANGVPGLEKARTLLKSCGAGEVPVGYSNYETSDTAALSAKMTQFQRDGITTLIWYPVGGAGGRESAMSVADSVRYRPEWFVVGPQVLRSANLAAEPAAQSRNSFGIAGFDKLNDLSLTPWLIAYHAAGGNESVATFNNAGTIYREMQLIATGAQMAGARLTPDAFGKALLATDYPNPGAAGAPSYQATFGFPRYGASQARDFVLWWVDPAANIGNTSAYGLTHAVHDDQNFCWVRNGERQAGAGWPAADGFRSGRCR